MELKVKFNTNNFIPRAPGLHHHGFLFRFMGLGMSLLYVDDLKSNQGVVGYLHIIYATIVPRGIGFTDE